MNFTHSISQLLLHTLTQKYTHTLTHTLTERGRKNKNKLSGPENTSSTICMACEDQPKQKKDNTLGPGTPGNIGSTHASADTKALLTTGSPKKANYQEKWCSPSPHTKQTKQKKKKKKKKPPTRHQDVAAWLAILNVCLATGGWVVRVITLEMHVQISSTSSLSSVVLPHQCVLLGAKSPVQSSLR